MSDVEEIREASLQEATELLAQGWKLISVQTVSKTVYILIKERQKVAQPASPQPEPQQAAQPEPQQEPQQPSPEPSKAGPAQEVEIYGVVSAQEERGKTVGEILQVQSYDMLPWTQYPKGSGAWIFADPSKFQDPIQRSVVQKLLQELEAKGEVADDKYVYTFSSKEKRFIKRTPKQSSA